MARRPDDRIQAHPTSDGCWASGPGEGARLELQACSHSCLAGALRLPSHAVWWLVLHFTLSDLPPRWWTDRLTRTLRHLGHFQKLGATWAGFAIPRLLNSLESVCGPPLT